jgi:hypothetical protein
MSFLYLTGSRFNLFSVGTVSEDPAGHAYGAITKLYDSDPGSPHIFSGTSDDSYFRVRQNRLSNGGFETASLSGWTNGSAGTGSAAETSVGAEVNSGTKAAKLDGSSGVNYGSLSQTVTVSAGEAFQITAWIKVASAGADQGLVYVQNLRTGKYLTAAAAWQTTRTFCIGHSTATYTQKDLQFSVESFDACRVDTMPLKIEIYCESGPAYFDDILLVSGVTFAGIFGHNYGPVSPLVQSSDDGSAWTTRSTMTIRRPAFYSTFSIVYAEYWQILLSGTNHEAPYTGEAVLGQYQTAATSQDWGFSIEDEIPGVRNTGPSGRASVYSFSRDPRQLLTMTVGPRSLTAARDLTGALWLRSEQGRYPVVAVPIDTESDVIFGRMMEPMRLDRVFDAVYSAGGVMIQGDPFPTVGL